MVLKQECMNVAAMVSQLVPPVPAMKDTQTCMPQEKESTRRCNTLTRSVGTPSAAMLTLCKHTTVKQLGRIQATIFL